MGNGWAKPQLVLPGYLKQMRFLSPMKTGIFTFTIPLETSSTPGRHPGACGPPTCVMRWKTGVGCLYVTHFGSRNIEKYSYATLDRVSTIEGPSSWPKGITSDGTSLYVSDFYGKGYKKLLQNPSSVPDIKANGSDGPVVLSQGQPVSIAISLNPGDKAGQTADWWVAVNTPFAPPGDWYTFVYPGLNWLPGVNLCAQTGLFDLAPYEVLNMTLPVGNYTFYFALDDPDGAAIGPWWGLDSVEVNVQ